MKDYSTDTPRKLSAEAKMLDSIDRICRAKLKMKRFATGSLQSITQKKKAKFRSTLSK